MTDVKLIGEGARIAAFGEILWDILPTGPKLGGAPMNFLYHAHVLGAEVEALTAVGDDDLGREALARLNALAVPTGFIQTDPAAPTGTVLVTVAPDGNPAYQIVENVAWDSIEVNDALLERFAAFLTSGGSEAAFYFGSLALRSERNRDSLKRLLAAAPKTAMRVCDLNLRPPFYSPEVVKFALDCADVFKLNDVEAVELDEMFPGADGATLRSFAGQDGGFDAKVFESGREPLDAALLKWTSDWQTRFGLKTIILTCGASGAYVFSESGYAFAPSRKTVVRDAVGAGDAFAAVCVVGLLKGIDLRAIVQAAARRAAFVCEHEGATPDVPLEEINPFE